MQICMVCNEEQTDQMVFHCNVLLPKWQDANGEYKEYMGFDEPPQAEVQAP